MRSHGKVGRTERSEARRKVLASLGGRRFAPSALQFLAGQRPAPCCIGSSVAVLLLAVLAAAVMAGEPRRAEVLYNGIRLPEVWPPRPAELTREPMSVPYLEPKNRPAVVPIDVGRQLFVDDFLVESTTLQRKYHQAEYHPASPVVKPDRPWEKQGSLPTAMVFSDGVWYDPADQLFKMWYLGGYCVSTCYATSRDGIHWDKPALDVEPGTNVVLRHHRDSNTVWLDSADRDPKRRWKMFTMENRPGKGWSLVLRASADGIHWSEPLASSPSIGDRTTVFYNPFRNLWVYSLRSGLRDLGRMRLYREHADAVAGMTWRSSDTSLWVGADRLDPHNPNPELSKIAPQLYNLDAVAYESLLVGLFSIWEGDPASRGFQKRNEVLLGFSRDGFHWQRPNRRPFAGVNESEGAWNWANVQSTGGGFLVVGDKLYFYQNSAGAVPGPWDCWLVLRGLKTLPLRLERQQQNAQIVAEWLEEQPQVARVFYPGLTDHPGHGLLRGQSSGFGATISFEVRDADCVPRILSSVKVFLFAESLGGIESLITFPAAQTHCDMGEELRTRLGINERLLRLSVGIEAAEDLLRDLESALRA